MGEKDNLKTSLINATTSIRKKFRKLHNDRVERRQILEEQYRPITRKIGKLVNAANAISSIGQKSPQSASSSPRNSPNTFERSLFSNSMLSDDRSYAQSSDISEPSESQQKQITSNVNDDDDDDSMYVDESSNNCSYKSFERSLRPESSTPKIVKPIVLKRMSKAHHFTITKKQNKLSDSCMAKMNKKQNKRKNPPLKLKHLEEIRKLRKYLKDMGAEYKENKNKNQIWSGKQKKIKASSLANRHVPYELRKTPARLKRNIMNLPKPTPSTGNGLILSDIMAYSNDKKSYVYWDDVNELCSRLRLLVASQNAGHTGHQNEIISIVEELRESNVIN